MDMTLKNYTVYSSTGAYVGEAANCMGAEYAVVRVAGVESLNRGFFAVADDENKIPPEFSWTANA